MINHLPIIIISGLSGSGKSTAIDAFEDAGYYCVENMPVALLPKFLELPMQKESDLTGLAFVMDMRESNFLSDFPEIFQTLRQQYKLFKIIFLETSEKVLLQRYSQTRRQHPLAAGNTLLESIIKEKEQLKPLRKASDEIIDTSNYNVHKLKAVIRDLIKQNTNLSSIHLHILSFGFKYGVPLDADLVIDVRFINNPYFVPHLKPLSGEHPEVSQYVINNDITQLFLDKYLELLDYLIPLYKKEGKAYLTIAIGCTGGRHRSVAIAQHVHGHLLVQNIQVALTHRDIDQ
jgi:RNase adapter protein RapZ